MDIVLLAAGTSSRMGKKNKLLLPIDGVPMISRTVNNVLNYLKSCEEPSVLILVTGYRHLKTIMTVTKNIGSIDDSKNDIRIVAIKNMHYRRGQFSSIQKGVSQVPDGHDFFIMLGDLPFVEPELFETLSKELKKNDVVRPFCNGTPGHPVLFASNMKKEILSGSGETGMKEILEKHKVFNYSTENSACIQDIDTAEDIEKYVTDCPRNLQ